MPKGTAGYKARASIDGTMIKTTNIPLADAMDTAETTVQGDSVESHIATIQRVGLDLTGPYDADDAGQTALRTAKADRTEDVYVFYPAGTTSGLPTITFTGICTQFNIDPGGPGGVVTYSAHVQLSNGTAPTYGTVA